jgi:hypothetical protein
MAHGQEGAGGLAGVEAGLWNPLKIEHRVAIPERSMNYAS